MNIRAAFTLDTDFANAADTTNPIAPVTVCCAPNLAFISDISPFLAQCKLILPPVAPAATPQIALQQVPSEIIGRKKEPGTKDAVLITSSVIPMSTIMSAKSRHRFTSVRNRDDAADVKSSVAAIPQPSRTMNEINADNAVAPSLPTPTPSNTRWVAKTDRS